MDVSDEAVEAAVLALAAKHDPRGEGEHGGDIWNRMVADVRLALEAAAPHLMASAWNEGWEAGCSDETDSYNGPCAVTTPNPYEKDEDATNAPR